MSLTGTLLSGVAGLKAQTNAMAILSDNIANINTIGYKKSIAQFSTLVVNSAASTTYSPGGVKSGRFALVDNQGVLQASNRPLDIAVTGNGFFAVNDQGAGDGNNLYTRAGSFHEDNQGRLVNTNGMYLMGWALDQAGEIADINTLGVVSVGTLNGVAVDTQNVTIGANLNSNQTIFGGNQFTTLSSILNGGVGVSANADLTTLGTTPLIAGDQIVVTVNGASQTFTVAAPPTSAAANEFSTLAELANLVDQMPDVTCTVGGTSGDATLTVSSSYAVTVSDVGAGAAWNTINSVATTSFTATYSRGGADVTTVANAAITDPAVDSLTGLGVLAVGDEFTVVVNGNTYTFTAGTATGEFDTLDDLVDLINASGADLSASIVGPTGEPTIQIHSPYSMTIDESVNTPVATLFGSAPQNITATQAGMQSGTITPQFTTQQLQVFDSLGSAHVVTMGFIRLDTNRWAYELYTPDAEIAGVTVGRGLLSAGNITFNGDGSLNEVTGSPPLYTGTPLEPTDITINWSNGSAASDISFDLGTPGAVGTGRSDGLTQFAATNTVSFVNQDGSAVGLRTGVSIDKDGFVIASFSNGATQRIYRVPVTTFADPTALRSQNGNTFAQTVQSGSFNWRVANTGGAGSIEPSSLESSNADLGDEFSNMIITQRAYSANAKTITTADDMLQELLQVKR